MNQVLFYNELKSLFNVWSFCLTFVSFLNNQLSSFSVLEKFKYSKSVDSKVDMSEQKSVKIDRKMIFLLVHFSFNFSTFYHIHIYIYLFEVFNFLSSFRVDILLSPFLHSLFRCSPLFLFYAINTEQSRVWNYAAFISMNRMKICVCSFKL